MAIMSSISIRTAHFGCWGRVGMGITFRATDTNLHSPVALKIISPHCFGGESSRRRFLREARVAAQIRHPNVAAVYHLDSQEGEFFYAMEFVDGITTEAWVQRRGPMTLGLALDVVMQVTRALTAADQLKVVHRDIKPGNIMILPDPADASRVIVKVIDFGLAQSLTPEASPTATILAFLGIAAICQPGTGGEWAGRHPLGYLFAWKHVVVLPDRRGAVSGNTGASHRATADE